MRKRMAKSVKEDGGTGAGAGAGAGGGSGRSSVASPSSSSTRGERSNSNFVRDVDLILELIKKIDDLSERKTYDDLVIDELISIGGKFSSFSISDSDNNIIRKKYGFPKSDKEKRDEKLIKFEELANLKFLRKDEKEVSLVKDKFEEIKNCFNLLSNNLKKILKQEDNRIKKLLKEDKISEIDKAIKDFVEQEKSSPDNFLDKLSAYLGDMKYVSEIKGNIKFFEDHIKSLEFDDKKGAEILAFGWFITAIGENSKKLSHILLESSGLGEVFKILSKARDKILKERETAFLFPYDDAKIAYLSNLKKEYQDNIDSLKSILTGIEDIFNDKEFRIDSYIKEKFDVITGRINQIDLVEYSDEDLMKLKKLSDYFGKKSSGFSGLLTQDKKKKKDDINELERELKKLKVSSEELDIIDKTKLLEKKQKYKSLYDQYLYVQKLQKIPKLVEWASVVNSDSEPEKHAINLDLEVQEYALNFTIAVLREYCHLYILSSKDVFIDESPLMESVEEIRQMGNKITHLDIDDHEEAYVAIRENLDDWKKSLIVIVNLLFVKKGFDVNLFGDQVCSQIQSQLSVHAEFFDDDKKMIKNLVLINSLNQLGLYNQVKKIVAEIDKKEDGENSLLNKYLKDSANNSEIKFYLLRAISVPYNHTGELEICLEYYLKCFDEQLIKLEDINPFGIARAYSEIGVINQKLKKYKEAIKYFEPLFSSESKYYHSDWLNVTKEEYSYKTKLLLQTMLSYADTHLSLGNKIESIRKLYEFEKNIKSILDKDKLYNLTLGDMMKIGLDLSAKYYRTKGLIYEGNTGITSKCDDELERLCSDVYESEWKKVYGQTYESEKNEIIVFISHRYLQIYRNSLSVSEKQECFEKLKEAHEEFLQRYSSTYGKEVIEYAKICRNLGFVFQEHKKYKEAEEKFLESERIYNLLLGEDSKTIDVANLKSALGMNYKYMDNTEYYKNYSKEAAEIFKYNIKKPDTQDEGIYYFSKHIINSIRIKISKMKPDNKITIIRDIVENELRKNIIEDKEIFRKLLEKVKEDFFGLWHMGDKLGIKESDISDSFKVEKYISDSELAEQVEDNQADLSHQDSGDGLLGHTASSDDE